MAKEISEQDMQAMEDKSTTDEYCKVEAIITIDERGQMVIPKEVREKAGFTPGEKLALSTWYKNGRVCCISLQKAGDLSSMVKDFIGGLFK
jgi:AbrB family looped-hinge helix DNA binding protein